MARREPRGDGGDGVADDVLRAGHRVSMRSRSAILPRGGRLSPGTSSDSSDGTRSPMPPCRWSGSTGRCSTSSVDLYRSSEIAGRFADGVRTLVAQGKGTQSRPVAIAEFGAASYRGAGDAGARSLDIVEWNEVTGAPAGPTRTCRGSRKPPSRPSPRHTGEPARTPRRDVAATSGPGRRCQGSELRRAPALSSPARCWRAWWPQKSSSPPGRVARTLAAAEQRSQRSSRVSGIGAAAVAVAAMVITLLPARRGPTRSSGRVRAAPLRR